MLSFSRNLSLIVALALLALAAASTASAADGPTAQASKHCSTGSGRGLGPTYAFKLSVSRTSCRNGRKLIRAYNSCRHKNGGARGHCGGVLGYRCSERRFNQLPRISFDANVKCSKSGGRRINHTYTQNL
jgi:opacity protein-like surface antigen